MSCVVEQSGKQNNSCHQLCVGCLLAYDFAVFVVVYNTKCHHNFYYSCSPTCYSGEKLEGSRIANVLLPGSSNVQN